MTYIATFYSHFGAVRFKRLCDSRGWRAQIMPVPRSLSSSCGSCVRYEGEYPHEVPVEVEQIVRVEGSAYCPVYRAKNS